MIGKGDQFEITYNFHENRLSLIERQKQVSKHFSLPTPLFFIKAGEAIDRCGNKIK